MHDREATERRRPDPAAGSPVRFARSFRGKIVLSTVALMTAAMLLVGLGIQLLLAHTAERDIAQALHERADAVTTVIEQASSERLTVPADSLEPGIQVFDSNGDLVAGSVESQVRDTARRLATTNQVRIIDGPNDEVRLLGLPFTTPSGDTGVIVVSQETTPYERSERYALLATGALGLLVICFTALIALRVTRQALEPVSQMAERASDWSEHDLSHRFALGPPHNEITALGHTLDHLLDRVASAILSEQRLTAELAHELRTPLTSIQGSADLALLRGVEDPQTRRSLEQILASAREMSSVIATLLDIAREDTAGYQEQTCEVADVLHRLVAAVPPRLDVDVHAIRSSARIAAPADLVARAVLPLVDNAVRHAGQSITFAAVDEPDRVLLMVSDDGPGVATDVRETLFQPGVSNGSAGMGLGLGIARRVARSFGGDIDLSADTVISTFVVSLPRR
jgi:two-component system, OmpR family, sensor kinase